MLRKTIKIVSIFVLMNALLSAGEQYKAAAVWTHCDTDKHLDDRPDLYHALFTRMIEYTDNLDLCVCFSGEVPTSDNAIARSWRDQKGSCVSKERSADRITHTAFFTSDYLAQETESRPAVLSKDDVTLLRNSGKIIASVVSERFKGHCEVYLDSQGLHLVSTRTFNYR